MVFAELACWSLGALLTGLFLVGWLGGDWQQRHALAVFSAAQAAAQAEPAAALPAAASGVVDAGRGPLVPLLATDVAAMVDPSATLPVAVLRIARIELEVPVFADTSERNLNRGAGWVEGTAPPGSHGNVAIAGHRDRHFRPLARLAVGDLVVLASLRGERSYRVSSLAIVEPEDVSPLAATTEAAITLVTCYPFHFIGNAPQRFIVRALAED
jgi:LPXTG-site transpeptidase (sortase) family protein